MLCVSLALLGLFAATQATSVTEGDVCTAHIYWGKVYYYTPATDESSWDRPAGCISEPSSEERTPVRSEEQAALQHSLGANSLNFMQSIHKAWEPFPPQSITLTIQADLARVKNGALNRLAKQWNGPISVAVLTRNVDDVLQYMSSQANMYAKNWADVHAVVSSDKWKHYPINRMRNFAIKPVRTEYMMVVDIDEDVTYSMAHHMSILTKAKPEIMEKTIYIVPSFQWSIENPPETVPKTQRELVDLMQKGHVAVKHPEYPVAYGVPEVSFAKWKELGGPMEVAYRDAYEPYFIARKNNLPLFDERFQGFGGNKAIHTLRLALEGFHFVLLPTVFTWCKEAPSISAKHNPPANPNLCRDAWWELGHAHGCDKCYPEHCASNCPDLFNKGLSKAMAMSGGGPTVALALATPAPSPSIAISPNPSSTILPPPSATATPSPSSPPNFVASNFEGQQGAPAPTAMTPEAVQAPGGQDSSMMSSVSSPSVASNGQGAEDTSQQATTGSGKSIWKSPSQNQSLVGLALTPQI